MGDTSRDPVDHARTTRQHAGESMKNGTNAPGLIAVAVGIVAIVVCLFAFATGSAATAWVAGAVSAVAIIGGLAWLAIAHRRVREAEQRWHADNPHAPVEPPTS